MPLPFDFGAILQYLVNLLMQMVGQLLMSGESFYWIGNMLTIGYDWLIAFMGLLSLL
jgi:hypothetical protein